MLPVCKYNRTVLLLRGLSGYSPVPLPCRALPDVLAGNPQLISLDVHNNALSALPGAWADASSSLAALPLTYCDVSMNGLQVCFTCSGAWWRHDDMLPLFQLWEKLQRSTRLGPGICYVHNNKYATFVQCSVKEVS